ncbi:hypothetical protein D770_03405 [Flammeovirgaceae bacterium 311]|nr:hypothetical protein D770_03405 [Flammeovirgaceae bacterium 311]
MKPALDREWQKLQSQSKYYWHLLSSVPAAKLKQQPAPDQWSLLQVMEHMAGVEAVSLKYLLKKNYTPLTSRSYLPQSIRALLLNLALRSPLKFKAPPLEELKTTNNTTPEALLQQWHDVRSRLHAYLEEAPAAVLEKPMFRHPVAGTLTLQQMLAFLTNHMDHHHKQVKRLLQ